MRSGLRGILTCVAPMVLQRRSCVRFAAARREQEYCAALAFDLETTGLDIHGCEIVQLAVVIANSKQGARFSRFVLPQGPIDPGASAVHGITRESLVAAGAQPFAVVWDEFEGWLEKTLKSPTRPLVWAAHNGNRFDFPILTRCVRNARASTTADEKATHAATAAADAATPSMALLQAPRAHFVDTLSLARAALPGRRSDGGHGPYTLASLYRAAHPSGAPLANAHDALADADALALVWLWLVEKQQADPSAAEFQEHLQQIGYGAVPPERKSTPRASGAKVARVRAAPATATGDESGGLSHGGSGDDSVMRVAGIGPKLASLLATKSIHTYGDLERAWHQRARSPQKMVYWLRRSLPGVNPLVIARAVKGMKGEWGE